MAPGVCSEMAVMDTQRILGGDPNLKDAVEHGMPWRVFHESVGEIPNFVTFAERCLNTDAREGVGEIETILVGFRQPSALIEYLPAVG